jgi:hypothetical protein
MKRSPSSKNQIAADQITAQEERRRNFEFQVALRTSTPDPFAMPPTGDMLGEYLYPWDDLESKQVPFGPQDPLAYGGTLNYEWHGFLRGPLTPFVEAFGILSPLMMERLPGWAMAAAKECLHDMKCSLSPVRPSSVGWCLGFGASAVKTFHEWGVTLRDVGQASPELKRHLFCQAAERVESETEAVRLFLNGFCDGIKAGQEINGQTHVFKWKLFIALKWAELRGVSRSDVAWQIRQSIKTKNDPRNEERQILKFLDRIGFPRGKSGPKQK